ncbi:uncharacterized protein LOC108632099 [Ceratina calcarata]|uniref:Uncharacterized protein LOC108632099 n=1 Tax=Ceratina calcarata TaxID=156304 RepID=A0AAJ7WG90_9HYME|nr:uncharacterized protein LOC108632099 [Ceratina calcarata]
MRCFKKFFQHTWQPQQMVIVPSPGSIWDYPYLDQVTSMMSLVYGTGPPKPEQELYPSKIRNPETHMESPSRFELTKAEVRSGDETELGEVKVQPPMSSVATSTPVQPGNIPCRNGGCKVWASRTESRMESPWHFLKTVFLISVIAALILWVIVYTFLAQYQIL